MPNAKGAERLHMAFCRIVAHPLVVQARCRAPHQIVAACEDAEHNVERQSKPRPRRLIAERVWPCAEPQSTRRMHWLIAEPFAKLPCEQRLHRVTSRRCSDSVDASCCSHASAELTESLIGYDPDASLYNMQPGPQVVSRSGLGDLPSVPFLPDARASVPIDDKAASARFAERKGFMTTSADVLPSVDCAALDSAGLDNPGQLAEASSVETHVRPLGRRRASSEWSRAGTSRHQS